jgi:hypothetical protein
MWLHHKIKKTMSLFAPTKEKRKKETKTQFDTQHTSPYNGYHSIFLDDVNQHPPVHHPLETCYDLVVKETLVWVQLGSLGLLEPWVQLPTGFSHFKGCEFLILRS